MQDNAYIFHRHELATRLTSMLLGTDPLSNAGRSGLFMSAARRTGKSTFLKNDLIPAVEAAGGIAVYVDLWTDRTRDPSDLMAQAVGDCLAMHTTRTDKARKVFGGIKKLAGKAEVAGFKAEFGFERESIGKPDGTTLAKAFQALHAKTGKQIVFMVDEAQHALTTEAGADTLFALKAARDALNLTADKPQLAILATGSLRGKISNLVLRKNQAFYGADVSAFPTLGQDFVVHLASKKLGHRFTPENMPNPEKLMQAFSTVGHRPEEMERVIEKAVTHPAQNLGDAMVEVAKQRRAELVDHLRRQMNALPMLQQAILSLMYKRGDDFEPFNKGSLTEYESYCGAPVSTSQVQHALDALTREGLVWRSSRGAYALDDEMVSEHFVELEMTSALNELKPLE